MATQPRLVNKQFNSPINLYSQQNIQEVLDREAQILANGAVGIDFRNNPSIDKPGNLKNSAVLRMLEEEENRQRNGYGPGNDHIARPLRENLTWPPPEYEHKNQLRSTFKDVVTPGAKRVAWPPPNESGLDGPQIENNPVSAKGGPQYSTTAQSPSSGLQQNNHPPTQNPPSRTPLKPLDVTQRGASPLASPITNQTPQGFRPSTPSKGWAPVHSPVGTPNQPTWQQPNTHYQTAHQPVNQQIFLGQQYQPSAQKNQYHPQQYQAPTQQQQAPSQQYQAPPQQYQAPTQQYQTPPQQYQAPSQQYQAPPQQYQTPPLQQVQAPPQYRQQHSQSSQTSQQSRPAQSQTSSSYEVTTQQYQSPSQHYETSSSSSTSTSKHYQTSSQQYQVSTQYQVQSQQVGQVASSQTATAPRPQTRPVEPPPSTITLRPQPPINQAPPPLITSQPATATLKGGKHLRGDLKWPPENVKRQVEEENRLRLELAKGPAVKPKRPNKDYTEFFEAHRLNSMYPGYKIPPGTQFYRPEF